MRALRFALFLALVAAWLIGWSRQDDVVEAYTQERPSVELRFDGFDLSAQVSPVGPSPYRLERAAVGADTSLGFSAEPTGRSVVAMSGGSSMLSGIVRDQVGEPVPGALVRVERVTSEGSGVIDVVADADGAWELANLVGGRFRVRAFVPNTLRTLASDVITLRAGAAAEAELSVGPASDQLALALVGPEEMIIGRETTVAVVVSRAIVDGDGVTVMVAVPSVIVDVSTGPGLSLLSESSVFSDGGGAARYLLTCDVLGGQTVTAGVGDRSRVLSLPSCVAVPEEPESEATT